MPDRPNAAALERATPEQLEALRDAISTLIPPLLAIRDAIDQFASAIEGAEAAARAAVLAGDKEVDGA